MADENFTTEELESEEWRPITRFPLYFVSSLGRVKHRDHVLKLKYKNEYPRAKLSISGSPCKQKTINVHPLVAEAFFGPRPEGRVVNHKDGDKANNRASNLEYVTHRQNFRHALRLGLMNRPRQYALILKSLHNAGVSTKIIQDAFDIPLKRLKLYLRD